MSEKVLYVSYRLSGLERDLCCNHCGSHLKEAVSGFNEVYCKFYEDDERLCFEAILCPHCFHEDFAKVKAEVSAQVISFFEANIFVQKLILKSLLGGQAMLDERSEFTEHPVLVEKPPVSFDTKALENLIKQRRNLIVNINGVYELSRPLVLELLKAVKDQVLALGGQVDENFDYQLTETSASAQYKVVIRFVSNDRPKDIAPYITVAEVGEASVKELGKETSLLRTAATRATKRVLEKLLGEDFINRVILSLTGEQEPSKSNTASFRQGQTRKSSDTPASDKQKEWIKNLQKQGKISTDIDVENLSKSQASELLDKFFKKK